MKKQDQNMLLIAAAAIAAYFLYTKYVSPVANGAATPPMPAANAASAILDQLAPMSPGKPSVSISDHLPMTAAPPIKMNAVDAIQLPGMSSYFDPMMFAV